MSQLDRILQIEKEQEDSRIKTGLRQLKQRLNSMETKNKYVSQLSKQQTNEHIQEIERVTNRKILEAETAEDKKAYLYKTISVLTETKNAILWKNRDLVMDLEEEYRQIEQCESELLREQYQAKYRELLGVSLENLDKMHDVEDEEERIFQEQQRARRQDLELSETLPLKHLYHEEYKPTVNELWLLDDNFGRTLEWLNKQDKDQYTKILEQTISRTTTRPSSPTSLTFLD
ncbi:4765_t:CDS:2, partial [Racocetra persica]